MTVWKKLVFVVLVMGWCVGNIATAQVDLVDWYLNKLKNEDRKIREWAARDLGELGDERAVEPLIAVLEDEASEVRARAAEALERIKQKKNE